jgi:hypothetical protein
MGCDAGKALKTVGSLIPGVGQVIGAIDAREAAKEAKNLQRKETKEQMRRAELANAMRAGTARARMGASGVRASGSLMDYLEGMEAEDARELSWLKKAGKSREDVIEAEGDAAFTQGLAGAGQTFLGVYGPSIGRAAKARGYWV